MLSDEAREARNAYLKEYRRTHKEAIKRKNELYWERRAAKQAEQASGNESESCMKEAKRG